MNAFNCDMPKQYAFFLRIRGGGGFLFCFSPSNKRTQPIFQANDDDDEVELLVLGCQLTY